MVVVFLAEGFEEVEALAPTAPLWWPLRMAR